MPTVFPFDPDWSTPPRERHESLTDILPGYDGSEQRVKVRQSPRLRQSFRVIAGDAREHALLHALLYGGSSINEFYVPLWQDRMPLTANAAGGASSIAVATQYRRFVDGAYALIWRDPFTWEFVTIDTVEANSIELAGTLADAWAGDGQTWVIPIRPGLLDPATAQIHGPAVATADLSFLCESVPTALQTVDILELEPSRSGDVGAVYDRLVSRLDSRAGVSASVARSTIPALSWDPFVWIMDGRAEVAEFLEFLEARQGRWKAFSVPTWQRDLALHQTAAADSLDIIIKKSGYTDFMFPSTERRFLAFIFPDGSKVYRHVASSAVDGETEILTLESAVGAVVTGRVMISFLRRCRLATDEPEITWHTTEVAEAALPFAEVRESDAALGILGACPVDAVPQGVPWTFQLEALNAVGGVVWSVEGPEGMEISSEGLLSYTPLSEFEWTVTLTDGIGRVATLTCTTAVAELIIRPTSFTLNPVPGIYPEPLKRVMIDGDRDVVPALAFDGNPDTSFRMYITGGVGTSEMGQVHYQDWETLPESLDGLVSVTFHVRAKPTIPDEAPDFISAELFNTIQPNENIGGVGVFGLEPAVTEPDFVDYSQTISAETFLALLPNLTLRLAMVHHTGAEIIPNAYMDWAEIWAVMNFA